MIKSNFLQVTLQDLVKVFKITNLSNTKKQRKGEFIMKTLTISIIQVVFVTVKFKKEVTMKHKKLYDLHQVDTT